MRDTNWSKVLTYSAVGGVTGLGVWSLIRAMSDDSKAPGTPENPTQPSSFPNQPAGPTYPVNPSTPTGPTIPSGRATPCSQDIPLPEPIWTSEGGLMGAPSDPILRNQWIVSAVEQGFESPIDWVPITTEANGHRATFWVMSDSLRIAGTRVMANAATTQKVADLLGASLLTPTLADLIFATADVRLPPLNRDITNATPAMLDQSRRVDAAIAKATGKPWNAAEWWKNSYPKDEGMLVANQGKHWVISPRLLETPPKPYCELSGSRLPIPRVLDRSCNYGWHTLGAKDNTGIPNFKVDGKKYEAIQGPGICHDICHDDYSQLICLVRNDCSVDGNPMNVQSVLLHPELAWLASRRTGAYPVGALRLPGVPVRPPRA